MTSGKRGHPGLLQKARDHLRRDHVAGVVEQLNRRAALVAAKGDRIVAKAVGNDERHRSVARLDRGLGGCRRVPGGGAAVLSVGVRVMTIERAFALQAAYQVDARRGCGLRPPK